MKMRALAEQFDGGRSVITEQEGPHVQLSVEATSGSNEGVALLTPAQARALAESLTGLAAEAERVSAVFDE